MPTRLLLSLLALMVALVAAAPVAAHDADPPPPRHVVDISGSREQGFHVTWSDREQWWTTTRSEALAECSEYATAPRRARCAAHERTRHRWMGLLKRSLRAVR